MTINAKKKIIQKIDELLPMDNTIPCEHYRNEKAIQLFYKFSYFFNIENLLRKYKREYLQYAVDSYTYPNGLIRLESYCLLNGEYVINQTIITDSLEDNKAIIHVYNKYELKALQQFFIKSASSDSLFGEPYSSNEERNIEINETEIQIENSVIGRFERIQKSNSNTIYAEKYMPINMITDSELIAKDILHTTELEILYRYNDKPIFVKLLGNKNSRLLKETQYNSNNYENAKKLIDSVIDEVDEIVKRIATVINKYNKKDIVPSPVKVLK